MSEELTEQILPCPFCGGKAKPFDHHRAWRVLCGCNAEGPCGLTRDSAVRQWNVRAALAQHHGTEGETNDYSLVPIPDMDAEILRLLTSAMRAADESFQTAGGGTRHYIRDCLWPEMQRRRLALFQHDGPSEEREKQ